MNTIILSTSLYKTKKTTEKKEKKEKKDKSILEFIWCWFD